jgi:diguanylate cyclase (GGDEF)-like protein
MYSALLHATSLMMEAIALHAIRVDDHDCGAFQEEFRKHARDIAREGITPPETLVTAGAAIHSLQTFTRNTEQRIHAQLSELRSMVSMLASALARACQGNQRAVTNLQGVEKQLKSALQLDDVRAAKLKLEECLAAVQAESERQMVEASVSTRSANRALHDPLVRQAWNEPDAADPVTGLPGKIPARRAFEEALQYGEHWAVVPVVVDRIEAVNLRFGRAAGDQILLAIGQILAQKLGPRDQLFRWHGPCFVALLERPPSVEGIRSEMARLMGLRIDHTIKLGRRAILLPVTLSWTVLPLWENASMQEIVEQVDEFVAKRKVG